MKDLLQWMRAHLLFDGEGGGAGDAGGGGGGPVGGDAGAGEGQGDAGGGGAPEPSFRQFIPEEDKDAPYWATIPDDATLVKNYANAQRLIGKKGIIPPGEGATAEDWQAFFAAVPRPADDAAPEVKAAYQKFMGAPEVATVYDEAIVPPEDFPKEFLRQDLIDDYKKAAFEAGVPLAHAKAMFDWYMGKSKADLGAMPAIKEIAPGVFRNETLYAANSEKIRNDFKAELGDGYEAVIHRADAKIWEIGGQEFSDLLKETGLSEHPVAIRAFLKLADITSEDKTLDRGEIKGDAGMQARLDEISRDPDFMDQWTHPDKHNALVKERDEIMAKLHPGVPGIQD